MLRYTTQILILLCFLSCTNTPKHDYEYIPLSKYENDTTVVSEGTELRILGMSGSGKENDKENVYYYHILAENVSNGDTLNILSPLFRLPTADEGTGMQYFSPGEYNYASNILDAKFENMNSGLNMLLQSMSDLSNSGNSTIDVTPYFEGKMVKNELVAFNKSLPEFKNSFKTVVGILFFNADPR